MNIIVVGCGRLGSELAQGLVNRKHRVAVIDNTALAFSALGPDFNGKLVEGDAMNRDVLMRAGIDEADGLVAVTTSDALNLVIGHVAKEIYNLPHVVVRNYNPLCRELFDDFNLQVVSSTSWGAQRIEELINYTDLRSVYSAGNGEVEVYEIIIPKEWNIQPLSKLIPQAGCRTIALTRAGRASIPDDNTILSEGDILDVSATFEGIDALRKRISGEMEI